MTTTLQKIANNNTRIGVVVVPAPNAHGVWATPTPPPLPLPQNGVPSYGGVEGQNEKIHWGIILCPQMMILQGVGLPIPYLGVCYANGPQTGVHGASAYA